MNRFFRSALFPLIVIVLLVYLASQTLIPKGKSSQPKTYSDVIAQVKDGQIATAIFDPGKQAVALETKDGQKETVHYPTAQSALQFQNLLQKYEVKFDSKGIGSSPWWSILRSLLPFVLLFG